MSFLVEVRIQGPLGAPVAQRVRGERLRVGRASDNDVVVPDDQASRYHAELRRESDAWVLEDLRSRHGTTINGRRLEGTQRLRPGDLIGIGRLTLSLSFVVSQGGDALTSAGSPSQPNRLEPGAIPVLVGSSAAMAAVRRRVQAVAATPLAVLVTGESGTGKELVARLLHHLSPRAQGPLVVVNCPALPGTLLDAELFGVEKGVATGVDARPGRLEMAHGGTLFLDEVGDLEPAAQARLLRFLQDGTVERVGGRTTQSVNARIVSATNRDLQASVDRGTFRLDLLHRLAGATIVLPPLRERREDILPLAEHVLARASTPPARLSSEAAEALLAHAFPGNVRELEQALVLAASLAEGGIIERDDLPAAMQPGGDAGSASVEPGRPSAADLHARLTSGGESFWDVVHAPFLKRELSRDDVRELLAHARGVSGPSWKAVARAWRIEADYRRLINFLAAHDLRDDGEDGTV